MVDFKDSSQLNLWTFESSEQLNVCRAKANYNSRAWLLEQERQRMDSVGSSNSNAEGEASRSATALPSGSSSPALAVSHFACGYNKRKVIEEDYRTKEPWKNSKGNDFLTPQEEETLICFYASKLPSLIGPKASISRLRRESKVTATATLLYRRFFLSNSVMLFDPKAVVVAAAFLASKIEDAMADVRYIQEGTERMQAPVSQQEIISAELTLLQGCHYDLLCFHPFKSVLALTEDLRTFLKSSSGHALVVSSTDDSEPRPISGQDLKPIYDKAKWILEQVMVYSNDLTLLYSPGPIGLASLIVAQDEILQQEASSSTNTASTTTTTQPPPKIEFYGYVQQRFPEKQKDESSAASQSALLETLPELCRRLKDVLKHAAEQKANNEATLQALKQVHKKLKKVRAWGTTNGDSKKNKKKKKNNNSSKNTQDQDNDVAMVRIEAPDDIIQQEERPPTPTRSNKRSDNNAPSENPQPTKRIKTEEV